MLAVQISIHFIPLRKRTSFLFKKRKERTIMRDAPTLSSAVGVSMRFRVFVCVCVYRCRIDVCASPVAIGLGCVFMMIVRLNGRIYVYRCCFPLFSSIILLLILRMCNNNIFLMNVIIFEQQTFRFASLAYLITFGRREIS